MTEERNYDDPRLNDEMRRWGCYTVKTADDTTQIILTPEFLANASGYAITMDMGFGKERVRAWKRNANGVLECAEYPDRLYLDETAGEGKYTARITLTCECGEEITLTHSQARIFMRGAYEHRYLPRVLLRCRRCNKMLFKP